MFLTFFYTKAIEPLIGGLRQSVQFVYLIAKSTIEPLIGGLRLAGIASHVVDAAIEPLIGGLRQVTHL